MVAIEKLGIATMTEISNLELDAIVETIHDITVV